MNRAFEISGNSTLEENEALQLYALSGDWDRVKEWSEVANRGMEFEAIRMAVELDIDPDAAHDWLTVTKRHETRTMVEHNVGLAHKAGKALRANFDMLNEQPAGIDMTLELPEALQIAVNPGNDPIHDLTERFIAKIEGATEHCRQQLDVKPDEFEINIVAPADAPAGEPTIYKLDELIGTYQYQGKTLFQVRREGLRFFIQFTEEFKPTKESDS